MFRSKTHRALALIITLLLVFPASALAQKRRAGKSPARSARASKEAAQKEDKPKQSKVVIPDLVTGQKNIEATIDYNTVNVALAPGAVVMVEFPARDSILRVHPADQNLVTVDDTDTKPNFPLIFRPGSGFVVSKTGPELLAIITVQMASGVPFVFQIYPVPSVKESATHIYVRYDRDKVVAARRAVGLPVNYKPVPLRPGVYAPEETIEQAAISVPASAAPVEAAAVEPAAVASPTVAAPMTASTPAPAPIPSATPAALPSPASHSFSGSLAPSLAPASARVETPRNIPVSAPARETSRPAVREATAVLTPQPSARSGRDVTPLPQPSGTPRAPATNALGGSLRDYIKEVVADSKAFSKYSKPFYGLSVAVSRPKDLNLDTRFIVIAVKNTLTESMRLIAGQPDLFVETLDDKKSPVLVEPIQKLGVETTAPLGDLLAPGATAYYAVAFTPPILGTHQYLRISVAQTTAADAPSSVDLTIKSR